VVTGSGFGLRFVPVIDESKGSSGDWLADPKGRNGIGEGEGDGPTEGVIVRNASEGRALGCLVDSAFRDESKWSVPGFNTGFTGVRRESD